MNALRRLRPLVGIGVAVGTLLGYVAYADAVDNVPNCLPLLAPNGAICNANCKLGTDVVCQPGQQIVLNGGADLDMDIYDISCATGQNCPTAAVRMTNANSIVKSTGNSEARILGSWNNAVACAGLLGSRVTGIRIDGHFTTAVSNCSKVDGNVIIGDAGSQRAVTNFGISDADFIMDNYFDGPWEDRVIGLYGSTGLHDVSVASNTFITRAIAGTQGFPIVINANIPASVTGNIFMGNTDKTLIADVAPSVVTTSGNMCDPTLLTCADARGSGECENPTAPFTTP